MILYDRWSDWWCDMISATRRCLLYIRQFKLYFLYPLIWLDRFKLRTLSSDWSAGGIFYRRRRQAASGKKSYFAFPNLRLTRRLCIEVPNLSALTTRIYLANLLQQTGFSGLGNDSFRSTYTPKNNPIIQFLHWNCHIYFQIYALGAAAKRGRSAQKKYVANGDGMHSVLICISIEKMDTGYAIL